MRKNKWAINLQDLDQDQINVINLNHTDSTVIKGCAGSGKTLLALFKAKQLEDMEESSYYIITYPKVLNQFIKSGLDHFKIPQTRAITEAKFVRFPDEKKCVDYLFIDESQDFAEANILKFKTYAKKGIFFFGDSAQQMRVEQKLYDGTKLPAANIEDIIIATNLPDITLSTNHRLPESIAKFAECFQYGKGIKISANCKKKGGQPTIIKKCNSEADELTWILDRINEEALEDTAILVTQNDTAKYVYDKCVDYFKGKRLAIEIGVRYKDEEDKEFNNLNFDDSITLNIIVKDSAKGVQFEHVFVPYCNNNDDKINRLDIKNLYAMFTRTSDRLYLTFSECLVDNIANKIKAIPNDYQLIP